MSLDAKTETALTLASQAFALAHAANGSGAPHDCGRSGTFAHAAKAAQTALLVVLDAPTTSYVCDCVWDCGEYEMDDLRRHVAQYRKECERDADEAKLQALYDKYSKEVRCAEKEMSDDTEENVLLLSAMNARRTEMCDMQEQCSRMSAKKHWGAKVSEVDADKATLSHLIEKGVL